MNFDHLFNQPQPIPLHAYAAFLAVIIGGWQLYATKGTTTHKYIGYLWVGLMIFVSISSFFIYEIRLVGLFSPIHLVSIFTIWAVYSAVRAARLKNIAKHKRMMKLLYVFALIITGLFTFLPGRVMHQVLFS